MAGYNNTSKDVALTAVVLLPRISAFTQLIRARQVPVRCRPEHTRECRPPGALRQPAP